MVEERTRSPPPRATLLERERRAAARSAQDDAAALCGDPPCGYSALDLRRAPPDDAGPRGQPPLNLVQRRGMTMTAAQLAWRIRAAADRDDQKRRRQREGSQLPQKLRHRSESERAAPPAP
jgi:hypothetical protein